MALKLSMLVFGLIYLANIATVQSTLFKFCDLEPSGVFIDPLILDETQFSDSQRSQRTYPAAEIARALAADPQRKAFLDGARVSRDLNRAAAVARNNTRSKRQVGAQFLADNKFKPLCTPQEKRIQYTLDYDGELCQIVEPQDLRYYSCADTQCDYYNPFPHYQTFRCEPDTYIYISGTAYCSDGSMRDQVFYVPINCCCRQYNCNMKNKYKIPRLQ